MTVSLELKDNHGKKFAKARWIFKKNRKKITAKS